MKTHEPDWPPLVCTRCGGRGLDIAIDPSRKVTSQLDMLTAILGFVCVQCGARWGWNGDASPAEWLDPLDDSGSAMGHFVVTLDSGVRVDVNEDGLVFRDAKGAPPFLLLNVAEVRQILSYFR